jgi:hypothetical protein
MLHLAELQGGGAAGAAGAQPSPLADANLAAFEGSLRSYLEGDDTQQPFDVMSA